MKTLYEVTGKIEDINTLLVPRKEFEALSPKDAAPNWIQFMCDERSGNQPVLVLSRCNWLYPNSDLERDKAGPLDGNRYAAIEKADGDIIIDFHPSAWKDTQHAEVMLNWYKRGCIKAHEG